MAISFVETPLIATKRFENDEDHYPVLGVDGSKALIYDGDALVWVRLDLLKFDLTFAEVESEE